MAKDYTNIVAGLDMGSSKMQVVLADIGPTANLRVIGVGSAPSSRGLKRGAVVNIDATVHSIQMALREATAMAECNTIQGVYTSITGSHIRGINSNSGVITVRNNEVSAQDLQRVREAAQAITMSNDHAVLSTNQQEYLIDNQEVRQPEGMSGQRLESRIHLVTGSKSAIENTVKCVRRCGLQVQHLMVNAHASSHAVLTEDEKELGVVLVDIGAGTTDVAIYANGFIRHTAVIPIAGELITNDIAMALHTPTKDAEEIKLSNGCAKQLMADPEVQVEVTGLGGEREPRFVNKQALAAVIEPRVEEIFALVLQIVRESGIEEILSSGFVLTGGSSRMPGMVELAEDIFLKPVRRGRPLYKGPLEDLVIHPESATVMGLLEAARLNLQQGYAPAGSGLGLRGLLQSFRHFIQRNF